jgi:hypothetical protein
MMSTTTTRHPEGTTSTRGILSFLRKDVFSHPTTHSVDFNTSIGGNLPPTTRELLIVATNQRKKLEEILIEKDATVDPRGVIAAVEAYMPSVWRLTTSFEAAGSVAIKINKPIEFKWTSPLAKKTKEWGFGVFIFEIIFVLSLRALAHRDTARVILNSDSSKLVEASRELRSGAGIFEFLRKQLLPRWANPPTARPLETFPAVLQGLETLYLADAQRLATIKAVESGSTHLTVCKLLMGAADKYEFAGRAFASLGQPLFDSLGTNVLEELGAFPAILRALAANELAQSFMNKGDYSHAAGLARDCVKRLDVIVMGKTLQSSTLQVELNAAKTRALILATEYEKDCANVYFTVPAFDAEWPTDHAFIASPISYEMPEGEIVSFIQVGSSSSSTNTVGNNTLSDSSSVKSYFESNWKTSMEASTTSTLVAPKGIDADAFKELPEDIQKEIIREAAGGAVGGGDNKGKKTDL